MVSIGGVFSGAHLVVVHNFLGGGPVVDAGIGDVRSGVDAAQVFAANAMAAMVSVAKAEAQQVFCAHADASQVNR